MVKWIGAIRTAAIAGLCFIGTAAAAETPPAPLLLITETETDPAKYAWIGAQGIEALTALIAKRKAGEVYAFVFVGAPGNDAFWSGRSVGKESEFYSLDDIARSALQRCEFVYGSPCFVISVNGFDATDAAGGLPVQPALLAAQPREFDVNLLPFVPVNDRNGARTYRFDLRPRAFVVTTNGGWLWQFGATSFEAVAKSLTECEKSFAGQQCILYAVNNWVVFPPDGAR